jgi:hypothetical protein
MVRETGFSILDSNSDKKLIFGKKKVVTPVHKEPVQLILRISEVLGSYKKTRGRF